MDIINTLLEILGPNFSLITEGAYFWDIDDNKYIDLMCAYGPSILGYKNPEVEEAANSQDSEGNTVSLASPVMVDLASNLVEMVDAADWALFGKNGGDSTSLAVMVAREATGKEKIVKIPRRISQSCSLDAREGPPEDIVAF